MGLPNRDFDRRGFLRATAGATVAIGAATLAGATPALADASTSHATADRSASLTIPKSSIGIQLYSVRDKVTQLGFRVVFETLAQMGYKEVEFAGYTQDTSILGRQITVPEIRQLLDDNGLRAIGSHVNLATWAAGLDQQLDYAEILGMKHVGTANAPSDTETVSAYLSASELFNTYGEAAADRGLMFYQHNHYPEFAFATDQPSVRLYDVFLANTDPRYVFLEMDVYWAYVGQYRYPGFDPAAYVRAHPYRYPLFHMKDGAPNPANPNGYDIVEFGAGDLPYKSFIHAIGPRGVHLPIWEQDTAVNTLPNPPGSLASARRSLTALDDLLSKH
jgi:sugar phosphate isomerase/epimerase